MFSIAKKHTYLSQDSTDVVNGDHIDKKQVSH